MDKNLITSEMLFEYVVENVNKKLKLKGIFQKAETLNENRRIYPKRILEREINNLQEMITERRLLGELNHPETIEINLEKVSHLVTRLEFKGNDVIGEAEVLSDTPYGSILEGLLKSNVKLGISSRGKGTTRVLNNNINEVNDDFKLVTFDIVSKPSTPGAFPESIYESKENKEFLSIGVLVEKVLSGDFSEKELIKMLSYKVGEKKYFT